MGKNVFEAHLTRPLKNLHLFVSSFYFEPFRGGPADVFRIIGQNPTEFEFHCMN